MPDQFVLMFQNRIIITCWKTQTWMFTLSPVSIKRDRLRCVRCVRCVNENRKKRKRLRWQAANHGCHCFNRAFLLAGACVCCVKYARNARNASDCVWMETGLYATAVGVSKDYVSPVVAHISRKADAILAERTCHCDMLTSSQFVSLYIYILELCLKCSQAVHQWRYPSR